MRAKVILNLILFVELALTSQALAATIGRLPYKKGEFRCDVYNEENQSLSQRLVLLPLQDGPNKYSGQLHDLDGVLWAEKIITAVKDKGVVNFVGYLYDIKIATQAPSYRPTMIYSGTMEEKVLIEGTRAPGKSVNYRLRCGIGI
ncbi:MAG: hypothetical protein K2X47_06985 [Bdellovibrionales bacterium]|nr:hypothetical protein [Bdellovibrionales bacterium]